jgi:hypothetical protein
MSDSCKVTVNPGVCRLNTVITANLIPGTMEVHVEIKSDCPNVRKMGEQIDNVSAYEEIAKKMFDTVVYRSANDILPHPACPVPSAVMKAIEGASGLCLKKNVTFDIE